MNNPFDLFNRGFINIDDGYSFFIVATLIEYDYPRCFIAKKDCDYFSFMECENDERHISWTVCKVNLEQIKKLHSGEANVQSLFSGDLFEIRYDFSDGCGNKLIANPSHEIKGNYFCPGFGDLDELFDIHGLQEASITNNENSVSIVFEKENEGSTLLILRAINYLKDFLKSLKNSFDILSTNLSVQKASTVITFTTRSEIDKDTSLIKDLKPLGNDSFIEMSKILSSNEPLELLSSAQSSKKVLTKYKGIIDTLKKEDSIGPKIVVAMSDYTKPTAFDMGKRSAAIHKKVLGEAIQMIDRKTELKETFLEVDGVLTGIYLTSKGSFCFKETNGQQRVFNGSIDISLKKKMDSFVVRGELYKSKIKRIASIVDGVEQKTVYILCDLTSMGKNEQYENLSLFD